MKQRLILGYRTHKLDTEIECQVILEKWFWESWLPKITNAINDIKKKNKLKNPLIITLIEKL